MGNAKPDSMRILALTLCFAYALGWDNHDGKDLGDTEFLEDAPAPNTLEKMVQGIKAGDFNNNFFEASISGTQTDDMKVGGCLLDKVGAIKNENGFAKFPNDLKVDLGACCTKGNGAKCVSELAPAYKDLDLAQKPGADVKGLASK